MSADGRRLYSLDNRRDVAVYDTATRRLLTTFPARATDLDAITADGQQLVVSGPVPGDDPGGDGRISVLAAGDGTTVRVLTTQGDSSGLVPRLTRDGRWLAAAMSGPHPSLAIYDSQRWRAPPLRVPLGGTSSPWQPAIRPSRSNWRTAPSTSSTRRWARSSTRPAGPRSRRSRAPSFRSPCRRTGRRSPRCPPTIRRRPRSSTFVAAPRPPCASPPYRKPQTSSPSPPEASKLLCAADSGNVSTYRTTDGSLVTAFPGHSGPAHALAWVGTDTPYRAVQRRARQPDRVLGSRQHPRLLAREPGPCSTSPIMPRRSGISSSAPHPCNSRATTQLSASTPLTCAAGSIGPGRWAPPATTTSIRPWPAPTEGAHWSRSNAARTDPTASRSGIFSVASGSAG